MKKAILLLATLVSTNAFAFDAFKTRFSYIDDLAEVVYFQDGSNARITLDLSYYDGRQNPYESYENLYGNDVIVFKDGDNLRMCLAGGEYELQSLIKLDESKVELLPNATRDSLIKYDECRYI
ncbi:hypothetical protein D1115_15520 [Vibrio alfacsensis]|uniref:Uncharacterized protein n=1 Tax=Vibrio alfacsensis TaxID=1074311 RepID=A0ABM6YX97_9VIBR|nr:hypothetical protein [Vibrio alfacsensis]AXY02472.1 hypothetical protein D1115_15520 [Vibrio alfacsensis]BBM67501.1 hypothetical protein VA249_41470 [Vibrio alfacsensis]